MAFVSGPRQCGKTTLAKRLLAARPGGAYHNWDDVRFRRIWTKEPASVVPVPEDETTVPLVVLDEIHKARGWKRTLKGVFDTLPGPADLLVTGSARLNAYRRGSDSLVGRYDHFRLHPFSMRELVTAEAPRPEDVETALTEGSPPRDAEEQDRLEALLRYGGFPEPVLRQNDRRARLWRRTRLERVLREDLRDLTRIPELSRIEMLASLLPHQVGSLLSVTSLREDLEVAHDTVRRWLDCLKELYYVFEVRPFQRRVRRTLRKAGKLYLWDVGEVPESAARFENLVASHLLKSCHLWTDTGEGTFELRFLRDKEKHEIDFLIVRDGEPWLPVEVKLDDTAVSPQFDRFLPQIGRPFGVQLVRKPGVWRTVDRGGHRVLVASAARALAAFA